MDLETGERFCERAGGGAVEDARVLLEGERAGFRRGGPGREVEREPGTLQRGAAQGPRRGGGGEDLTHRRGRAVERVAGVRERGGGSGAAEGEGEAAENAGDRGASGVHGARP